MDSKIIKSIKDSESLSPQGIYNKFICDGQYNLNKMRLDIVNKFLQAKNDHPKYSKSELCNMIGTSPSTLLRIMKDYNIPSPYRYNIQNKKKPKESDVKNNKKLKNLKHLMKIKHLMRIIKLIKK